MTPDATATAGPVPPPPPGPKLPPRLGAMVKALGLTATAHEPRRVTVRCPHCPGVREVTVPAVYRWAERGRIPPCQSANAGGRCR